MTTSSADIFLTIQDKHPEMLIADAIATYILFVGLDYLL
jgi:hypothetical protein